MTSLALSEDGVDVIHNWMTNLETRALKHTKLSIQLRRFAVSQRACVLTLLSIASAVAFTRAGLYFESIDLIYGSAFFVCTIVVFVGFAIGWLEKSVFHLQQAHKMQAMKTKLYEQLKSKKFSEETEKDYNQIITLSNNLFENK